nr:hypothetical protein MFLOJ_04080 [Mycobacterium florentinum]
MTFPGSGPRAVEGLEGQPVEDGINRFGARNRGLDNFGYRHLTRLQCGNDSDGVELAEGIVAKGMYGIHLTTSNRCRNADHLQFGNDGAAAMMRPLGESRL